MESSIQLPECHTDRICKVKAYLANVRDSTPNHALIIASQELTGLTHSYSKLVNLYLAIQNLRVFNVLSISSHFHYVIFLPTISTERHPVKETILWLVCCSNGGQIIIRIIRQREWFSGKGGQRHRSLNRPSSSSNKMHCCTPACCRKAETATKSNPMARKRSWGSPFIPRSVLEL